METGANGVNGMYVARHVNKENSPEPGNAIRPNRNMVERNVMENPMKYNLATKISHAQVNKMFTPDFFFFNMKVVCLITIMKNTLFWRWEGVYSYNDWKKHNHYVKVVANTINIREHSYGHMVWNISY